MAEYRRLYPEEFRFNKAPFVLVDSSVFIEGYRESIQLEDNRVVDSIHSNFHNEMPDTTTVMPYSSISVAGPRVRLYFASGLLWNATGTGSIVQTDSSTRIKDSLSSSVSGGFMTFPTMRMTGPLYIRMTLNGRPVFDWTDLNKLPSTLCKGVNTYVLRGRNYPPFKSISYATRYLICDTTLNLHDQLLIEVKEGRRNWMLDRFNITRVAAAPTVDALRVTGSEGISALVTSPEKKTSGSTRESRTSR
jgi:hypothetical protein